MANFLVAVPELVVRGRTPFAVKTDRVFESAVSKALAACDRALATRSEFPEMARYAAFEHLSNAIYFEMRGEKPECCHAGSFAAFLAVRSSSVDEAASFKPVSLKQNLPC